MFPYYFIKASSFRVHVPNLKLMAYHNNRPLYLYTLHIYNIFHRYIDRSYCIHSLTSIYRAFICRALFYRVPL